MKEMLGGCCVCSDENGWAGNPLVYCDGPDCEVAVHQGCYGILEVPDGEWLCAKCQVAANGGSPLKSNGVSDHRNGSSALDPTCDLCPFGYGALKRTAKNSWAHVICALYIPEVKFGDVHSMDPVILDDVPNDRYDRICYLCDEESCPKSAKMGACMNCNRSGCKKSFHVTCAQRKGLLCEEGGLSKNVKYCGYCAHHLKKAALDPSIKIVPPCKVRPLQGQPPSSSSRSSAIDRSIEKTIDNHSSHRSTGSDRKHKSKYSSSSSSYSSLSNSVRDANHHSHHSSSHQNGGERGGSTASSTSSSYSNSTPRRPTSRGERGGEREENGERGERRGEERMMIDQIQRPEPTLGAAAAASSSTSDLLQGSSTGSTTFSPPLTSSSRSSLAQEGATPPLKESLHLNGHGGSSSSLPGPSTSSSGAGANSSPSSIPMGGSAATTVTPPMVGRGVSPAPSSGLFNGIVGSHHLTNHNRLVDASSPLSTSSGGFPSTSKGGLNGHVSPSPHHASSSHLIAAAAAAANSASMLSALSGGGSTTTHNHPNVHPSVSGSVPVGAAIAAGLVTPKAGLGAFPVASHTTSKRGAKGDGEGKSSKRARVAKSSVRELLDAVEPLVADTVADFQRERVDKAAAAARSLQQAAAAAAAASVADPSPYAMGAQRANTLLAAAVQAQHLQQRTDVDVKPNIGGPSSSMDSMGLNGMPGVSGLSSSLPPLLPSSSSSSLLLPPSGVPQGVPATMEELLERQWEQGSSFLISNSHFDVAQLLSCLHQLKKENSRLEDTLSSMTKRRDHLLALNARLAMPLGMATGGAAPAPALASPASAVAAAAAGTQQLHLGGLAGLQAPAAAAPAPAAHEDSLQQLRSLAAGGRAAPAARTSGGRNSSAHSSVDSRFAAPTPTYGGRTPAASVAPTMPPSFPSSLATSTQSPSFPMPVSQAHTPTSLPSGINAELERLAAVLAQSNFLTNPATRQQLMGGGSTVDPLLSALLMQQQHAAASASSMINPNTAALMRMFMNNSAAAAGAAPAAK
ncbi:hypothetical protein PFISCL1PPCAC_11008 [Pristionchus fissidentatus]|uniref:PHD finger motif containing protein n=1 Tax=Pristionchus fissidentatus TaxID=1538716 RepID=A0AAV5VJB9_9BILA|nr:hypothetical protein PFISCL1PPCAC_11008 [Pristionchus fissidentatus]